MRKRAKISLYVFLFCAFVALSIAGYFIFKPASEDVRIGKKFVTFSSVGNAASYSVCVESEDGLSSNSKVGYVVNKSQNGTNRYDYEIDVNVDGSLFAKETYTQTIVDEHSNTNKIDCVISNYTIFFVKNETSKTYPDQTLKDVDKDIFCCTVSEYFSGFFNKDGNYTIICTSCDKNGEIIEENTFNYNYHAFYEEDFLRRGEFYYQGKWYDYVIKDINELNNFVWWAILYRQADGEDLSFYVSSNEIKQTNINYLVLDAINNYPEYDGLEDATIYAKMQGNLAYLTNFNYYLSKDHLKTYEDLRTKDTTLNKFYYNSALNELHQIDKNLLQGYISSQNPSTRSFAIDNAKDEVVVYNTEQLFMVVQSGAKPVFVDGESDVAKAVYNNALEVLSTINNSDNLTSYQKLINIYRFVTGEIAYDHVTYEYMNLTHDYTIKSFGNYSCFYLEGVFYNFENLSSHYAVCDGLSKAVSLLCNIEGIDCIKVNGTVKDGNHAWNRVYVEGNDNQNLQEGWYYLDATWGEGSYQENGFFNNTNYQYLTHTYFLFEMDDSRTISYPENIEENSSKFADYYKTVFYTVGEETFDYFVESDEELSHALTYAQNQLNQQIENTGTGNFVIELELDKNYLKSIKFNGVFDSTFIKNLGVTSRCEYFVVNNTVVFRLHPRTILF